MTNGRSVVAACSAAFFSLLIWTGPCFGQDPPSRVARLNWMEGAVSFQPAGLDTWTSATLNFPLTTGDHIYTDRDARAEMHVGPNAIRLSPLSNFGYLNLDDRTVQMRFTEGSLEVRVRNLAGDELYEVDTPQGAISLLRTGDYRIDCDPDRNATMVTVRTGEAEVTANGQAFAIHPRQTAFFSGDNPPDIRDANPLDAFDDFTIDRNRREERPRPHEYVPPTMAGCEDLYTYGQWRAYPGYGSVWVPPVQAGWAPYQFGHWAWVEPWGWTWIDDAPWGFAPFHYGRWAHVDIGWIWVPGPVAVRPVYAPALVVFLGGPRFSIAVGIGAGVAWFPLGPREIYRPAYHVSNTYVNQVNITNVTNINVTHVNAVNARYVNQNVPGAVTAVPQNAFVSRQPVRQAMRQVSPQQMAQAQVVGTAPPVAPQRASLAGTGRENVPRPRESLLQRQVVAKQPTPAPPVAFEAKQQALAQNPGRPVDPQAIRQMQQRSQPAVAPVRPANVPRGRPATAPPGAPPAPPTTAPQPVPQVVPQPAAPQPNVRETPSPPPAPRQRPFEQRPAERPIERPAEQPRERMDTRPPSPARPAPQAAPAPAPAPRTAPAPAPATPPAERPAERGRPVQRPEPRPATAEPKRDGRRDIPKEDKKEEKKDDRRDGRKQ